MKIIYLPGYSLKNKIEGENITTALQNADFKVYFHHWRHWNDESVPMDFNAELKRIKSQISEAEELTIIGKSIGTYVALKLINLYKSQIQKVILLGIPFTDLDNTEKSEYYTTLKSLHASITIIQNSNDPHGSSVQIKELLKDIEYEFIEKSKDDHSYDYPSDILKIV